MPIIRVMSNATETRPTRVDLFPSAYRNNDELHRCRDLTAYAWGRFKQSAGPLSDFIYPRAMFAAHVWNACDDVGHTVWMIDGGRVELTECAGRVVSLECFFTRIGPTALHDLTASIAVRFKLAAVCDMGVTRNRKEKPFAVELITHVAIIRAL
jgi:hypothetical protein